MTGGVFSLTSLCGMEEPPIAGIRSKTDMMKIFLPLTSFVHEFLEFTEHAQGFERRRAGNVELFKFASYRIFLERP